MCGFPASTDGKQRRISVLFAVPYLGGGGAEHVISRILKSLDRKKFRPSILLFEKKGVFCEDVPEDVPILDCGRYGSGGRWMWIRKYVRYLREKRPDVLVSFLWEANLIAVLARFFSGKMSRLILSERSTIIGSREGILADLLRRAVIAFLYPIADRIVPNSQAMARQLVDRFGIQPRKVVVIPNPVDTEEIVAQGAEGADPRAVRDTLPVVAGMGRLSREKGFDLLIRSVPKVRAPFRLVLMGEGPEEKNLQELAARVGVSDRVLFTGFLRNPYALLARAEVFVLPSRYEGFPNGLLEAMALGRASVATRCPTGPEEIITDGVDGLLVPVEDLDTLAAAIDRLLGDPGLRERLGSAARERIRAYDAPGIVRRFEDLIEEVTG